MTVQRSIQDRLDELRRIKAQVRVGTVTSVDPLQVALGGADTSYSDVRSLALVTDGATVAALVWGNDLLVLGEIGDGIVHYIGDTGEPAFTNSWVNFDNSAATPGGGTNRDAGYYKAGGRVYLTGTIKSGSTNTSAFTLPAGYRPKATVAIPVTASGGIGQVVVASAGTVTPQNVGGAVTTQAFLDGVYFIPA